MMHGRLRSSCGKKICVAVGIWAALGIIFVQQLQADEAAEKKAAELLSQYVEATGGKAAFNKIKNRTAEMTLVMPVADTKMKLKAYFKRPNKSYLVIEAEGRGKMEQGCDGNVVWEKSELTGCRIKTGRERAVSMREATLDRFVRWKKIYDKAEFVGMEDVDGRPCYKIVMTTKAQGDVEPDTETVFIDTENSLISKIAMKIEAGGTTLPISLLVSDYRDVDGVKLSHKMVVVAGEQETVMTIDSVKNNVDLPDDRFELPAEVQELLGDK
jgi:outer membrane lipoprotein-sorting protein